jgi:Inner membrane component of T3SS, cytoplasmic domain
VAVLRIHAPVLGQQERVFEWDGRPITVGRDDGCDVVLLEQAASRHHARLERHGDEIRVFDSDSANGVWVGDERVTGSRVLHDGEVIRIGDTTLALVLDPHRQPTLIRDPGDAAPSLGRAATMAQVEVPTPVAQAEAGAPWSRDDLASGPTLAAPVAPAMGSSPTPPAPVSLRAPASSPVPASSLSAYSLGSEPTLAAQSGPNLLGVLESSAPSVYSLGEADTLVPHAEPVGLGPPHASSASVYSLGNDAPARSHEPDALGRPLASSTSVYSLGDDPPAHSHEPPAFGLRLASSFSVYSIGDVPTPELRGPDISLPPAPAFDGVVSSVELGAPPPRPALSPAPRLDAPPPRPPALVAPPSPRSAASSWGEWSEPAPAPRHRRSGAAAASLWLGVGLFIGGMIAIVIALAAGYEPSELASLLGAAPLPGGSP